LIVKRGWSGLRYIRIPGFSVFSFRCHPQKALSARSSATDLCLTRPSVSGEEVHYPSPKTSSRFRRVASIFGHLGVTKDRRFSVIWKNPKNRHCDKRVHL